MPNVRKKIQNHSDKIAQRTNNRNWNVIFGCNDLIETQNKINQKTKMRTKEKQTEEKRKTEHKINENLELFHFGLCSVVPIR